MNNADLKAEGPAVLAKNLSDPGFQPASQVDLPIDVSLDLGQSASNAAVLLDWLVAQPELPVLVQVLPTADLYRLVGSGGLADSLHDVLEIVEWIRGRALVRLFDHDLWRTTPRVGPMSELAGRGAVLDVSRFLEWVSAWSEIGPEFAGERYLELDEEPMILLCRALFEVVPVGLEGNRKDADDWFLSPDRRFHLRFRVESPEEQDRAAMFLASLYAAKLELATRVFSYAAMLLESEAEEEALRWRASRMADDGFVGHLGAVQLVRSRTLDLWDESYLSRCRDAETAVRRAAELHQSGLDTVDPDVVDAVDRVLADDTAVWLRRHLGSADSEDEELSEDLDSDEPEEGRSEAIVRRCWAKLVLSRINSAGATSNGVVLGLGSSHSGPTESSAPSHLQAHSWESDRSFLESSASGSSSRLIDTVVAQLSALAIDSSNSSLSVDDWKTRIAQLTNAVASLLDDPAGIAAQRRSASAVRAYLNLGLEWLVDGRPRLGDWARQRDSVGAAALRAAKGVVLIKDLGPEAVFRAGCDLLGALGLEAASALDHVVSRMQSQRHQDRKGSPAEHGEHHFGQAQVLEDLVRRGRFAEVSSKLAEDEALLDPHIALLARCLLRRVPVFPFALEKGGSPQGLGAAGQRLSQSYKLLETPREFGLCWSAINSWTRPQDGAEVNEKAKLH